MSLAWVGFLDDARAGNVAGTFEYFDTEAQNIVIRDTDDALVSTYDAVDLGQWQSSVFENALRVGNFGLSQFVPRHNYNGEIWAVGITPTTVPAETGRFPIPEMPGGFYLYRYRYFQDLTDNLDSFDTTEQSENFVHDAQVTIKGISEAEINKNSSLFNLGGKVICKIGMGDSAKMPIATIYIDEVDWNANSESMSISGRNSIGFFLSDQTFDETRTFSGTRTSVVTDMLTGTGIDMAKVFIEIDATVSGPTFEPTQTIIDGLNYVLDVWGWKIKELPNGNIIIGTQVFMETFAPITVHSFDNNESFARGINQRIDGAYSRLALQSTQSAVEASDGPPVVEAVDSWTRTVFKDIPYLDTWNLGNRRTLYINVLDDMSAASMEILASQYMKAYQYIGINMSRELPIHPEIACGDPFEILDLKDGEFIDTGIITSVAHKIDVTGGTAKTIISVNSGGTVEIGAIIKTFTAQNVTGDTRKRELIDVIKKAAKAEKEVRK